MALPASGQIDMYQIATELWKPKWIINSMDIIDLSTLAMNYFEDGASVSLDLFYDKEVVLPWLSHFVDPSFGNYNMYSSPEEYINIDGFSDYMGLKPESQPLPVKRLDPSIRLESYSRPTDNIYDVSIYYSMAFSFSNSGFSTYEASTSFLYRISNDGGASWPGGLQEIDGSDISVGSYDSASWYSEGHIKISMGTNTIVEFVPKFYWDALNSGDCYIDADFYIYIDGIVSSDPDNIIFGWPNSNNSLQYIIQSYGLDSYKGYWFLSYTGRPN
jgi:hypothetical protein